MGWGRELGARGSRTPQPFPSRARAQAGSPWRCRETPPARPPNHCRGEIFRGIIIRDSMVRISGTGEGKEREVRAGSPQHRQGVPKGRGGPTHQCNKRSHPSPSSSRLHSLSPPGTADPCRLWGEDRTGTLSPPGWGSPQGDTPYPRGDAPRRAPRSGRRTPQLPPGSPGGT